MSIVTDFAGKLEESKGRDSSSHQQAVVVATERVTALLQSNSSFRKTAKQPVSLTVASIQNRHCVSELAPMRTVVNGQIWRLPSRVGGFELFAHVVLLWSVGDSDKSASGDLVPKKNSSASSISQLKSVGST